MKLYRLPTANCQLPTISLPEFQPELPTLAVSKTELKVNFSSELNQNPVFQKVSASARKLGVDAYVVGGYVRDLILHRPCKDVDFVCVGSGIELAQLVAQELGGLPVTVFKNFGTAMIRQREVELEFVGARKDRKSVV